jgi:hypothetical protein
MKRYNIREEDTEVFIYFNDNSTGQLQDIITILRNSGYYQFPREGNTGDTYDNVAKYILRMIEKTKFFCSNIELCYIKDVFEIADVLIVLSSPYSMVFPNGNIFAVSLIRFCEDDNSLFLDLISSHIGTKYAGEKMMKHIIDISELLFFSKIKLESLPETIRFYEKYCFIKTVQHELVCEMEKQLR